MKSLFTPLFTALAKTLRTSAADTKPNDEWNAMLEHAKEPRREYDEAALLPEGTTLIVGAPVYLPSLFNAPETDSRQRC